MSCSFLVAVYEAEIGAGQRFYQSVKLSDLLGGLTYGCELEDHAAAVLTARF